MVNLYDVNFDFDDYVGKSNLKVFRDKSGSISLCIVNEDGSIVDDGTLLIIKTRKGSTSCNMEIFGDVRINERIGQ